MILAVFRRVVRLLIQLLRRIWNMLRFRRETAYAAVDEALSRIVALHSGAWVEEGADPERAVLPRKAITDVRTMLRRALITARDQRDVLASRSVQRAWAERLAGFILHQLDVLLAEATGAVGYTWLRTTSTHPRSNHLRRVGKFYRWGDLDDEPGEAWGCKCGARPVFQ